MSESAGDITELLVAHQSGDEDALDEIMRLLYNDLRRIAKRNLRQIPEGQTLDTHALVHESYLRLLSKDQRLTAKDRSHFLSLAACVMRRVVVDNIRERFAQKRGSGAEKLELRESIYVVPKGQVDVLELDQALDALAKIDDRLVTLVECRFFAGYSEKEIAEILNLSRKTVQRDWKRAQAWLRRLLTDDESADDT